MVSCPRRVGSPRPRTWLWAGLAASTAIAVADAARQKEVLLTGVIAGPLLAAIGASAAGVAVVAVYAIALSLVFGAFDDAFLTSDHILRVIAVVAASVIAVACAWMRERRESELEEARPEALDAQRLRLALASGDMGTW